MKRIKIYQPGLISLILLPLLIFYYSYNFQLNKDSQRVIQLNMPDLGSPESEMNFTIENLRIDIEVLAKYNLFAPKLSE